MKQVHMNLVDYEVKLRLVEAIAKLEILDYHTFFYNDGFTIIYEY
jgi:hypothetical protein